ncbi:MAG TPA: MarR family winged helix-turn-helix transcriptional regulator [Spirochaetota bacterium]|nr:MarR family winged helix-turn-helix transcriptional regulator [Spirochaetota bacterium]
MEKKTKRLNIPRGEFDETLYQAMIAVYQFDRLKVLLFGLTYQDSYLLYFLKKNKSARIGEIADELSIHISTASRAVDKLEHRKLVARAKDEKDRRNVLVSLAPAGEMLMQASDDHSYYTLLKGLDQFSNEEIMVIYKAAGNLGRLLGVRPGSRQ